MGMVSATERRPDPVGCDTRKQQKGLVVLLGKSRLGGVCLLADTVSRQRMSRMRRDCENAQNQVFHRRQLHTAKGFYHLNAPDFTFRGVL